MSGLPYSVHNSVKNRAVACTTSNGRKVYVDGPLQIESEVQVVLPTLMVPVFSVFDKSHVGAEFCLG